MPVSRSVAEAAGADEGTSMSSIYRRWVRVGAAGDGGRHIVRRWPAPIDWRPIITVRAGHLTAARPALCPSGPAALRLRCRHGLPPPPLPL